MDVARGFSLTLSPHFLYYLFKDLRKELITVLESTLDKMAENILSLDEASLASLWEKYKTRMERCDREGPRENSGGKVLPHARL